MQLRPLLASLIISIFCGCTQVTANQEKSIRIVSWGGIPADKADTLYAMAKECGFDTHLGLYRTQESAIKSMDAAARAGVGIIINFPQIKDSTEQAIPLIKDHPALVAYHIKDEPDTSDFVWLKELNNKVKRLDPYHPCYINLLPNWSWGEEEYAGNIELFASSIDIPFYSFDNYPIIEVDGEVLVRPEWYRNLEEFSAMARKHGKPFWGFALATSHSIVEPEVAYYPQPTLGHLRLQVFSNLLYGAQAIQYFNFLGIVDPKTCEKKPAYDLIKVVNSEIRAYEHVFAGCKVKGVWHIGESIPPNMRRLDEMPHKNVKSINVSGTGAVVSLIENSGKTYLAIQNNSCINLANIDISFSSKRNLHDTIQPGDIIVFRL